MMDAVKEHAPVLGVAPLCEALGASRATAYRTWHRERFPTEPKPRPKAARALNDDERQAVLDGLLALGIQDRSRFWIAPPWTPGCSRPRLASSRRYCPAWPAPYEGAFQRVYCLSWIDS